MLNVLEGVPFKQVHPQSLFIFSMKKLFHLFILLSVCHSTGFAGDLSKRYKSFLTGNGMLYFINPTKMQRLGNSIAAKDLIFDITYLSKDEDSVSYTATVITNQIMKFDNVLIQNAVKNIKSKTEIVYCEPKGAYYVNRIRFYIKWAELKELYENEQPYILDFGNNLIFSFNTKKWKIEKDDITRIIKIVELNTQK